MKKDRTGSSIPEAQIDAAFYPNGSRYLCDQVVEDLNGPKASCGIRKNFPEHLSEEATIDFSSCGCRCSFDGSLPDRVGVLSMLEEGLLLF